MPAKLFLVRDTPGKRGCYGSSRSQPCAAGRVKARKSPDGKEFCITHWKQLDKAASPPDPSEEMVVAGITVLRNPAHVNVSYGGKMALLARGELTVADMDDEEIARMQFRNEDGTFASRRPGAIPRKLVDEMSRELIKRCQALFQHQAIGAVNELGRIATQGEKESDRLRAISEIIERNLGKTPDKVEFSGEMKPWEVLLSGIEHSRAIDAEVIEDEVTDG